MRPLRTRQFDGGSRLRKRSSARMSALWIDENPARDVVLRDVIERGIEVGGIRHLEAARRIVLSRLAKRGAMGEEAGQTNGRGPRIEVRRNRGKSSQRQADQRHGVS